MAKCNDKLEHRSAQVKFPPQAKLSALQQSVEAANPMHANRQQSPLPETDPAFMHVQHLWRFRLALALYTGAFPNAMRLQPCSVRYVSYIELLQQYQARPHHRRK